MKYNLREGVSLNQPITLKYPIVSDIIPQLLAWFKNLNPLVIIL